MSAYNQSLEMIVMVAQALGDGLNFKSVLSSVALKSQWKTILIVECA